MRGRLGEDWPPGHLYAEAKKMKSITINIRRNRFFGARVVNPWNDLDEKTVRPTVDTGDTFKRQLSEFGY